jgi:hypothetical protein
MGSNRAAVIARRSTFRVDQSEGSRACPDWKGLGSHGTLRGAVCWLGHNYNRCLRSTHALLQCSTKSNWVCGWWELDVVHSGAMENQTAIVKKPTKGALLQVHLLDGAQLQLISHAA